MDWMSIEVVGFAVACGSRVLTQTGQILRSTGSPFRKGKIEANKRSGETEAVSDL